MNTPDEPAGAKTTDKIPAESQSNKILIKCPGCSVPTPSLKRYGVMREVIFLVIYARSRRCTYTACPKCMRRMLLKDTFSPVKILLANLMWILAVLPYSLILMIVSTIPGHSKSIRKACGIGEFANQSPPNDK